MGQVINIPGVAAGTWREGVADEASLPVSGNQRYDARISLDDETLYFWSGSAWVAISGGGGGGGVDTVGSFSGSAQTNGASISSSTITFGPASATVPGMVSTGTQSWAGAKTFTTAPVFPLGTGVAGPASSTDLGVATWNSTTGTLLRNNAKVLIDSSSGDVTLVDKLQKLKFVDGDNYITRENGFAEMIYNVKPISGDSGSANHRFQIDGVVKFQIALTRLRIHDIDTVWKTANTYDLGNNEGDVGISPPRGIYAGTGFYGQVTTEALPSYSFYASATRDANTGFGSAGADTLFASTGGSARQRWTDSLTTLLTQARMNGDLGIEFGSTAISIAKEPGFSELNINAGSAVLLKANTITRLTAHTNGIYTYWGANSTQMRWNTFACVVGPVGNVGSGVDTLWTQSVAAGLLNVDGHSFRARFTITTAANANAKTVVINFGGTAIATIGPFNLNAANLIGDVYVSRRDSTHAYCSVTIASDDVLVTQRTFVSNVTATLANAQTFLITGEGTADNDIVIQQGNMVFNPAN